MGPSPALFRVSGVAMMRSHTFAPKLSTLNKFACIVVAGIYVALVGEIVWFALEGLHIL